MLKFLHRATVSPRPVTVPAVIVLGLCAATPSLASRIDELADEVTRLERQAAALSFKTRRSGQASQRIAEHRLVDAQVLYGMGDYGRAAIILLDYVSKYPKSRGYPEALFFLADSLYRKRDFLSARRYFRTVVDRVKGPYYQDALQRLVELSLRTGDPDIVRYLAALEKLPAAQRKPAVPYVQGKYYYFRKDDRQALRAFAVIQRGKPYFMQAQYFVGAILTRSGDIAGALKVFRNLLRVQPQKEAERYIRQLTYLALGRLYYQQGKISKAIDEYQKVSRRSKAFDTALYEICWAYVKAKQFPRALRALDLLSLAQPNSPHMPQVRVLKGNLLIRLKHWGRATELFQNTRDKFVPIHSRMEQIMREQSDPDLFFDSLLQRNEADLSVSFQIPPLAVRWVRQSTGVKRALHLVADVRTIDGGISEIKELIGRLERAVNSPGRIKIFPQYAMAMAQALEVDNRLAIARGRILALEYQLVEPLASDVQRQELAALAAQRLVLEKKIERLPREASGYGDRRHGEVERLLRLQQQLNRLAVVVQGLRAQLVAAEKYFAEGRAAVAEKGAKESFRKEVQSVRTMVLGLQAEFEELEREFERARDAAGIGGPDEVAERDIKRRYASLVDREHALLSQLAANLGGAASQQFAALSGLIERCRVADARVAAFGGELERTVDQKLGTVRAILAEEQRRVDRYYIDAGGHKGSTNEVAGAITYDGFQQVAKRFYEIIVRADVGIIDVAWALKDEKTREVSRLVQQQKLDLKLLDSEFQQVLGGKASR